MSNNSKHQATPEELEKFEQYLFEMDDALEPFVAAAEGTGFPLDYSLDSLQNLEGYLLSRPSVENDGQLQNPAARYAGEVFRKCIGGQWKLCLKSPKYLYFKLPVITGYSDKPIEFCPIEVIANFVKFKEPGLLRRAMESHFEFKK